MPKFWQRNHPNGCGVRNQLSYKGKHGHSAALQNERTLGGGEIDGARTPTLDQTSEDAEDGYGNQASGTPRQTS